MSIITIILLVLLLLFVALAAVLAVVLMKLSHELQRLDTDTGRMQTRVKRRAKQLQAVIPALKGVQSFTKLVKSMPTKKARREKRHDKKI